MTEDQRRAVTLRDSGATRKQIAQTMGRTERQVKRLLENAKKWERADPAARTAANAAGSNALPHSFWVKTDTHSVYYKTPTEQDDFLQSIVDILSDIPAYQPQPFTMIDNDLLTVYPLYDIHAGMMAWGRETGGQDYDLDLFHTDLLRAIETVSRRSPDAGHALVIFGGDTLHVDDYSNETPASRHKQDADGRFEKIADVAIHATAHAIEALLDKHARVTVVVLRGNHDESSHIILKAALKERYRLTDRVVFQPCVRDVFWLKHGKSLIFAHHGDKMPPQRLAMIVADQCPHWSDTRYRVALTGHTHSLKVQDFPGVTHYTLRAFAPADAYGASFGGVRGICAMTFSERTGLTVSAHDPIERD